MKKRFSVLLLFLCLCLLFSACSGKDKKAVGVCGDYEILYEELRYVTLSCRDEMEQAAGGAGCDPDSPAFRAELEATVRTRLADSYVILAAVKERLPDLSLEDEAIQAAIDREIENATELYGGKSEFKKALKTMYMTEHLLRFSLGVAELQLRLTDSIAAGTESESETAYLAWLKSGNAMRVRKIFVPVTESDPTGSETATLLQSRLAGGTAPEDLLTQEEKAAGMTCSAPTYLTRGAEDADTDTAIFALSSVGAYTPVIPTDGGAVFYVRVEDKPEYLESLAASLLQSAREELLENHLAPYRASVTVTFNDYGNGIDLVNIK